MASTEPREPTSGVSCRREPGRSGGSGPSDFLTTSALPDCPVYGLAASACALSVSGPKPFAAAKHAGQGRIPSPQMNATATGDAQEAPSHTSHTSCLSAVTGRDAPVVGRDIDMEDGREAEGDVCCDAPPCSSSCPRYWCSGALSSQSTCTWAITSMDPSSQMPLVGLFSSSAWIPANHIAKHRKPSACPPAPVGKKRHLEHV